MTVLRRLDAVLEPTKQAVLDMKASLDAIGVVDQKAPLREAAGQAFYNTSQLTLKDLRARASSRCTRVQSGSGRRTRDGGVGGYSAASSLASSNSSGSGQDTPASRARRT